MKRRNRETIHCTVTLWNSELQVNKKRKKIKMKQIAKKITEYVKKSKRASYMEYLV